MKESGPKNSTPRTSTSTVAFMPLSALNFSRLNVIPSRYSALSLPKALIVKSVSSPTTCTSGAAPCRMVAVARRVKPFSLCGSKIECRSAWTTGRQV